MTQQRSSSVTEDGWPTDEQVWDCIRLTFGERAATRLSVKRWKDGIDIDYPTHEAMSFARQLFAMGFVAGSNVPAQRQPDSVRNTAANAIRTFCQSLGAGVVVVSSDGVERIYYAGISLDALSVAVALALPSTKRNTIADSTGEKTGTHGASKEAGGHSRDGLTPVSTPDWKQDQAETSRLPRKSTECGSGK